MTESVLVGIPEIAEIADVTRSAVSNWRKRYNDFPEPRVQTESGVLFDLGSVEDWLIERDKLDGPVPPGALVWRFADALRGSWPAEQFADFLSSWIVYLDACERAVPRSPISVVPEHAGPVDVPPEHRWADVQRAGNDELSSRLALAARVIEARNPVLDGLLGGLAPEPFPDAAQLRAFVAQLDGAAYREDGRIGLLDRAQERVQALDRFAGGFDTPESVGYLMSRLAGSVPEAGTVVDPAVGTGRLLSWWAAHETHPSGQVNLLGVELNDAAARDARARFFVSGVEARVRCEDSLRLDPSEWPRADVVLLDPPLNVGNWGDAALYRDKRWTYGAPPAGNANLAWAQLCVSMLKPTGRAVLALPTASLTRSGPEARIRQELVNAGAVEAIVELPARLRRDTSIPITLWLLRAPVARPSAGALLLVDASRLGTSGRLGHELDHDDIVRVLAVIESWRNGENLDDLDVSDRDPETPDLVWLTVDASEVVDGNLSPQRYRPLARPDLASLRTQVSDIRSDLSVEVPALVVAVKAIPDPEMPGAATDRGHTAVTEVRHARLGDLAEILTPTADSWDNDSEGSQNVYLKATADGFEITRYAFLNQPGRVLVIRPRDDQTLVSAEWLHLWTGSRGFRELLDRHATGTTHRWVPASALRELRVPVPTRERQDVATAVMSTIDRAEEDAATVIESIRDLRSCEIERLLVEATAP